MENVYPALLNHQMLSFRLLLAVGILVHGSAMLATTRTAHPARNAHQAPTRTRQGALPARHVPRVALDSGITRVEGQILGVEWLGVFHVTTQSNILQ